MKIDGESGRERKLNNFYDCVSHPNHSFQLNCRCIKFRNGLTKPELRVVFNDSNLITKKACNSLSGSFGRHSVKLNNHVTYGLTQLFQDYQDYLQILLVDYFLEEHDYSVTNAILQLWSLNKFDLCKILCIHSVQWEAIPCTARHYQMKPASSNKLPKGFGT